MFAARPWSAMRRIPGLIVLVLALAIPAVGATAASSAPEPAAHVAKVRHCKPKFTEMRTSQNIRATGLSCPVAVKVAMKVASKAPSGCVKIDKRNKVRLVSPCVRSGYRCTWKPIVDGLGLEATCRNGAKTIRFQY